MSLPLSLVRPYPRPRLAMPLLSSSSLSCPILTQSHSARSLNPALAAPSPLLPSALPMLEHTNAPTPSPPSPLNLLPSATCSALRPDQPHSGDRKKTSSSKLKSKPALSHACNRRMPVRDNGRHCHLSGEHSRPYRSTSTLTAQVEPRRCIDPVMDPARLARHLPVGPRGLIRSMSSVLSMRLSRSIRLLIPMMRLRLSRPTRSFLRGDTARIPTHLRPRQPRLAN